MQGRRPFPAPRILAAQLCLPPFRRAAAVGWMPIPDPGELLMAEVLLHPHLWEASTPCWELRAPAPLRPNTTSPGPALAVLVLLSPSQPLSWLSYPLPRSWGCRGASGPFPGLSCTGWWSTAPLGEDSGLTLPGSPDPMDPFAPCVPPAPLTVLPLPQSLPARGPSVSEHAAESVEMNPGEGPPEALAGQWDTWRLAPGSAVHLWVRPRAVCSPKAHAP